MDKLGLPVLSLPVFTLAVFPVLTSILLIVLVGHKLKIVAWRPTTRRHSRPPGSGTVCKIYSIPLSWERKMVTIISPSVFLSKCESRLRDERASKDSEETSFAHAVSGNSLHNFVLKNLFVDNDLAGYR